MQQHQQHQRQQQRCPSRCLIILALMKAGLSEGFRFPVEPIPHVCNGGGGHLRGGASHQLVHPRTKVGAPCIPSPTDPTVFQAIDRPEEMLVKTDDETENEARGNPLDIEEDEQRCNVDRRFLRSNFSFFRYRLSSLPLPRLIFRRIDGSNKREGRGRRKENGSFRRRGNGFWRRLYAVQATQSWRGLEVGAPWKGAWGREKSTMLILT